MLHNRSLSILLTVVAFICLGTTIAHTKEPGTLTPSDFVRARCDGFVKRQYPILQDKVLTESLQRTAKLLADASGKPIPDLKVVVLNDQIPNIFSFPNQIYLTTGLLEILDGKDELAYLMAREIGYLANQTQVRFYESEKSKALSMQNLTLAIQSLTMLAGAVGGAYISAASAASATLGSSPSLMTQMAPSLISLGASLVSATTSYVSTTAVSTDYTQAREHEVGIENRLAALNRHIALAKQKGNAEASKQLTTELARLNSHRDEFTQKLHQHNPRYASLWHREPVMPSETPTAPNEYLLRFKVTDSVLLVWLIKDGRSLQAETIPVSREVLREKVQRYLQAFQHVRKKEQLARYDTKLSNELYNLLFSTVAEKAPAGSRVIIVPDDVLEVLPFESLMVQMPGTEEMGKSDSGPFPVGAKYLADSYQISYYFSATSLSLIRQARKDTMPSQSLFMMADPLGQTGGQATSQSEAQRAIMTMSQKDGWTGLQDQFMPLPHARELSGKLKQLFPDGRFLVGSSAMKDNLSGIEKHKYVVFATHGILAREIPYIEEPALLLYPEGGTGDEIRPKGFLTMSEVMKMNLSSDNVSLTACSTGLGRRASGEGVMSMGWAFQYAGAKSVLVSLWNVEEKSSVLLATKYFERLREGKNKMAALSDARAEVRRMGYEHPFYWAPFILIGEVN
jgi:CHAT domain-containing protein